MYFPPRYTRGDFFNGIAFLSLRMAALLNQQSSSRLSTTMLTGFFVTFLTIIRSFMRTTISLSHLFMPAFVLLRLQLHHAYYVMIIFLYLPPMSTWSSYHNFSNEYSSFPPSAHPCTSISHDNYNSTLRAILQPQRFYSHLSSSTTSEYLMTYSPMCCPQLLNLLSNLPEIQIEVGPLFLYRSVLM